MTTENNKTETARRDSRLRDIRKATLHPTFFPFILPDSLRQSAEKALPHRRKHRYAPQKRLFRHTEKPLWHDGKAPLAAREKGFGCVGQHILLCVSRIGKTLKTRVFAAKSMSARKNGGIFELRCIFMHAPMYIYSYINIYLRISMHRTVRMATVFLPPHDNTAGDAPRTLRRRVTQEKRRHGYAYFCIFNGRFCIFIQF